MNFALALQTCHQEMALAGKLRIYKVLVQIPIFKHIRDE